MLLSLLATEVMRDPGGQRTCHLSIFPFIPNPPQFTPGSGPASSFQHYPSPLTEAFALAQLPLLPFYFKNGDGGHSVTRTRLAATQGEGDTHRCGPSRG